MRPPATLVLAWGNPGRRDDGLGPAFAEAISARRLPDLTVKADYQLQIENAADLAGCGRVLFVDAEREGLGPFRVRPIEPEAEGGGGLGFTSHGVSPARVLALARDLFGAAPQAWLMGIRGYDFDGFGEGLSNGAGANLDAAVAALVAALAAEGGRRAFPLHDGAAPKAEQRGGT